MEEKICRGCLETFTVKHGNQGFCSERCNATYKVKKQKENNAICREINKGFLKNYKLFSELLPALGQIRIPVAQILKIGFDQNAFYGTAVDEKKATWYKVNEYMFNLSLIDNQAILYIRK